MNPNIVRFKDKSKYAKQVFKIERFHPADATQQSAWLSCVTDPSIVIDRYVKMNELEQTELL